jgi:protein SCO1/2
MVKPRFYLLLLLFIGAIAAAYYWSQPAVPEQADYYPAGRDINPLASRMRMHSPLPRPT